MDPAVILPRMLAGLNAVSATLLVTALVAIKQGLRGRHKRLMVINLVGFGDVPGRLREPVGARGAHSASPATTGCGRSSCGFSRATRLSRWRLVPLALRTFFLGFKQRFAEHRRIARWTFPVWLYISVTGVVIYWMNHHLRPPV